MTAPHAPPPGTAPEAIDDETLHALVDGRLPPDAAQALRARLTDGGDGSPAPHRQDWQDWEEQRARLRALHADWAQAPVPPPLAQAAQAWRERRARQARAWRMAGMAASWVFAFGLGWTLQGAAPPPPSPAPLQAIPQRFALQAAAAHAVYQPEQRHPVEVGAAQQEHLVQWLSKRLERPLQVPQLQALGYELVGGRLLPGDAAVAPSAPQASAGARAQFMYQNAAGQRITLYLGALAGAHPAETAFRYEDEGPVPSFYWVEGGFGYALSGPLPREALLALATAVHAQL
ncbi:anti-sigma factor [Acidovorax sp. GBBC 3334]|uniref:anti-sigma factor family protein n=1 Tax=Acidovorax sp. GBBC 3334 TaxID=2940496 RepID=UPI002302C0AB|nr:anti-sigma factor [Acidovorax sp. GBBC 3334]MDA8456809.1 anti-sigma factor [Acidovorax sp. GBBC 3334]